jgi:hypothetical protein
MDTFTSRLQLLICIDSVIDRGGADPVLHTRYDHDHAQELDCWSRWSRSTASPSRSRDPIINTGDWGDGTVIIFRHTARGIPAIWSPSRLTLACDTDRNSANAFSESPESAIWTRAALSPTPRAGSYILAVCREDRGFHGI